MKTFSTIPPAVATPTPSTEALARSKPAGPAAPVAVGEIVLVQMDKGVWRPLLVCQIDNIVTADAVVVRLSGPIFCLPGDLTLPAFRGGLDRTATKATILGNPGLVPTCVGTALEAGDGIGHWRRKDLP